MSKDIPSKLKYDPKVIGRFSFDVLPSDHREDYIDLVLGPSTAL